MNGNRTWHVAPDQLTAYVDGVLVRSQAVSVETHLEACPACRAAIGPLIDPQRLEHNLAAITSVVEVPRPHPVERLLVRIRVPGHVARMLVVAPSELATWLTGILLVLIIAGAAATVTGSDRTLFVFLVAAPLLPLVGVTSAVTFYGDPLRELLMAVPTGAFRLFLVRSLSVLTPTIALTAGAAILVPRWGWEPMLWLLPAFGLTASTLALGTWLPIRAVAWALGAVWTSSALLAVRGAPPADAVERFAAFQPVGQLVLFALSLLATGVVTLRRDSFDLVDIGRTT